MITSYKSDLSSPIDVQFDITRRCQLNCSYCCAAPLDGENISKQKAISVIQELSNAGVISLLILGGEPTLHPNFLDILSAAADNIPMVSFGTNGIRLAKGSMLYNIKKIAPNVLITISLDSIDSSINDINRGYGGNLAIKAIERCYEEGLSTSISCVLTESNIDSASNIISYFYPKVRQFSFFPRVPRSESERYQNYPLFLSRLQKFINQVESLISGFSDIKVQLPFKVFKTGEQGVLINKKGGCICHLSKAYITTDLNVYPCYYSMSDNNLLGNLYSNSFPKIWSGNDAKDIRKRGNVSCLCDMSFFEDRVPTRFKTEGNIYIINTVNI
jgi:MoaA/NifB/PqqE/SkfB family radical SAM enzyme